MLHQFLAGGVGFSHCQLFQGSFGSSTWPQPRCDRLERMPKRYVFGKAQNSAWICVTAFRGKCGADAMSRMLCERYAVSFVQEMYSSIWERISGITPILPLDWSDRPDASSPLRRILRISCGLRRTWRFPYAYAEECAIWSHVGKLIFARSESSKESGWGALASVHNAPEREQIEVAGVSLDAWSERIGLKAVRAAKMDVEGAEFAVLQGARRVLQQMRPILLLEMNESLLLQAGVSAVLVEELLRTHGYKLRVLSDDSLQPWRTLAADESVDCVAIPEEFTEVEIARNSE